MPCRTVAEHPARRAGRPGAGSQRNRSRSRGIRRSEPRPSPTTSTPRTIAPGTPAVLPITSSAAAAISSATAICVDVSSYPAESIAPLRSRRATSPATPNPRNTSIGLADYDKLVGLLSTAFDGTAQKGSTLPILYDEFGIESTIPDGKRTLYSGTEPTTTKPVDESKQAGGSVPGSYSRVADSDMTTILAWMKRMRALENERWRFDEKSGENVPEYRRGQASIFADDDKTSKLQVPKPDGARAFEVVGIPLKKPGFYVVELASPRLGAALLSVTLNVSNDS